MDQLERAVREDWAKMMAILLAQFRRLDLVEDALADAVEAASQRWTHDGVPTNPVGWLLTTARRRMVDRLRSEDVALRKQPLLLTDATRRQEQMTTMAHGEPMVEDEVLRLVLMCAHPALAPESASALSLRLVLGVSTADIARLFLVSEATMAARLTRAKKRIVGAGIPFAMPEASALPERLDILAQTIYLAFTAGYSPGSGPDLMRAELAGEAIRLARVTLALRPGEPALVALLALMLLQHSRRDARVTAGKLVLLPDQDRTAWHGDEIAEAMKLLATPSLSQPLSQRAAAYLIQARIAAEHPRAATGEETRWDVILGLYNQLLQVMPTPSARLARAVAVAEHLGPAAGLEALDEAQMPTSHRPEAIRAELFTRLGDTEAARAAYDQAIAACPNDVERAHLIERRAKL